jgi:hypothetical protein
VEIFLGAELLVFSRTYPPAVRCISSLRYEDAASIRAQRFRLIFIITKEKILCIVRTIRLTDVFAEIFKNVVQIQQKIYKVVVYV